MHVKVMLPLRTLVYLYFVITSCCCYDNKPRNQLCNMTDTVCNFTNLTDSDTSSLSEYDKCHMTFYNRNSTDCLSLNFDGKADVPFPSGIELRPYLYVQESVLKISSFNVSFSNVSWNFLRLRYQQNGNEHRLNYCRDFTISPAIQISSTFEMFWDCLWSESEYERYTVSLELSAKSSHSDSYAYKKFTFSVPDSHRIDPETTKMNNWEILIYVDVSDLKNLVLNFAPIPDFNRYMVTMYGKSERVEKEIMVTDLGIVQMKFETPISGSPYSFTVQALGEGCSPSCFVSKSPSIIVIEDHITQLAMGLYLFLACIVVLLAVSCLYIKKRILNKEATVASPPVVLFIYKSTHKCHVAVIDKLCSYLESQGIIVLLDRRDIQKSTNKDPYHWFVKSFEQADAVLVFSNLQCCPEDTIGIHRRVDDAALVQLKGAVADKKHRFARILLPYCNQNDIPIEASKFKLISLPNELQELIMFIKVNSCMNRIITVLNSVDKNSDVQLADLKLSIKEASTTLEQHKKIQVSHPPPLTLKISDNYLNDEEGIIRFNEQVGQVSPGSSNDEIIYPNIDNLNLYGEDFNQLLPSQGRQRANDDFSNVKFSNMKL